MKCVDQNTIGKMEGDENASLFGLLEKLLQGRPLHRILRRVTVRESGGLSSDAPGVSTGAL